MKNKSKQLIMSIVATLLLILLTIGVTYAILASIQMGSTENTVTAGTLKFLYTENTGVGAGIALTDALPVSDTVGKSYSTEGKVFDFSIEATNTGNDAIPYEVTLRKKSTSTLAEDAVKVYLTNMTEDADSQLLEPTLYSNLTQTQIDVGEETEKTIYTDSVAGGELTYLKKLRLRMWIDENVDFSSGNYNEKTFTAIVNVYSNESIVSGTSYVSIFGKNFKVIEETPNLKTASTTCTTESSSSSSDYIDTTNCIETSESGLYKSTATNTGEPTYYFRGAVENNYIDFAGFTWRVVRINEDGTIRIVMQDGINNTDYKFNTAYNNKSYMYYSNSDTAKPTLETWYTTNIASNENYSSKVATGNYYCEQAKVAYSSSYATNSGANMTAFSSYTPNFKCETDANGYGIVNANIGLLSYDEVVYAGGYFAEANSSYYLYNTYFWTMSPAGFSGSSARVWSVAATGSLTYTNVGYTSDRLRAVLNLKADTAVTGLGTSDSHWAVVD